MEFLNDIWLALSVPDENLIKLILIIFLFCIEMPLTISLIQNIFKLSLSKKDRLLYIFSLSIIGTITMIFIPSPFNVIVNYISAFIVLFIITKMHPLKVLFASILPSMFYALLVCLTLNAYLNITNLPYEQASTIPIYRIPYTIMIYSIIFIINLLIKQRNISIDMLDEFDKRSKHVIYANFIFGILSIIAELILIANYIDTIPLVYTSFNFICLLAYFLIGTYSISSITKLSITTKQLESAEAYNKTLHILHDNVRCFKHDFDNIVTTIGGFINTNDLSGLKTYYLQLEQDCEKVNNLYILNPDSINNPRDI